MRIGRVFRRPSPGTGFGLAALVIALGGAAFAAIPDSSNTIHACYQKASGDLRVVGSAGECRPSERALSWSAGLQGGSGVVARATSSGVATSNSPQPFRVEDGAPVPLTGHAWTQAAAETDQVFGEVEITPPPVCSSFGGTGFLAVSFFIDGQFVGEASSHGIADETLRITAGRDYAYEPGSPEPRTLTATAADTCQDGNHFTVDSVRVSVEGIR
jgi:hypothetical protein